MLKSFTLRSHLVVSLANHIIKQGLLFTLHHVLALSSLVLILVLKNNSKLPLIKPRPRLRHAQLLILSSILIVSPLLRHALIWAHFFNLKFILFLDLIIILRLLFSSLPTFLFLIISALPIL